MTICPVGIDPDAVAQLCNEPSVMGLMHRWSKQTRVRAGNESRKKNQEKTEKLGGEGEGGAGGEVVGK